MRAYRVVWKMLSFLYDDKSSKIESNRPRNGSRSPVHFRLEHILEIVYYFDQVSTER
ncbi:uncharacterized protein LACBIDRAFT_299211 [Laccaria bicolor S238N-H82]|uniref:Predicted protein n=1 Tax=Laccaria bicolor (strain S238N-H82 / ATCC MYA-4686) TaxID=486041 RepID=B0DEA1_LACBS|nr:uncharacterized protein LACBIDRAFT_299211 [Laccaria bicolor S238N-H82]EDR07001.1 predicted protein [Laccaria bicolor S238N-H82]|eukprot:XP_001882374.1 predicted protein [Laccaria bicolor S238N-H82]